MTLFLIQNVINHARDLRAAVAEGAIPILPLKFPGRKLFFVDKFRTIIFYKLHQLRNGLFKVKAGKEVQMIRYVIYGKHLMPVVLNDPGNVFLKLVFPFRKYHRFAIFYGKYKMYINLAVGIDMVENSKKYLFKKKEVAPMGQNNAIDCVLQIGSPYRGRISGFNP